MLIIYFWFHHNRYNMLLATIQKWQCPLWKYLTNCDIFFIRFQRHGVHEIPWRITNIYIHDDENGWKKITICEIFPFSFTADTLLSYHQRSILYDIHRHYSHKQVFHNFLKGVYFKSLWANNMKLYVIDIFAITYGRNIYFTSIYGPPM